MQELTLEQIVTGRGFADLRASPLQLAICRAVEGRPLDGVIDADLTERHFGLAELPGQRPQLITLVCGVRAGKSFLLACAAIHASLTADLRALKPHELPRAVIIGPTVDSARSTFVLLLGILRSSTLLSSCISGDPTADTVVLERPSDRRKIEVTVVAAHRGGLSVRGRWLAFFGLEELAQFNALETGHIVNAEEILNAAQTRLLPNAQGWCASSPFGPQGLLYQLWKKHFGKPGRVLVVHAPTRALNPSFSQAQVDAIRAENPDVAAREYDGSWLDADAAYFPAAIVDPAIRTHPLERLGRAIAVGMDPATRGNSWTVAVAWHECDQANPTRKRVIIGAVWSWTGSKIAPLSPRDTLTEIARVLRPYGIKRIHVDQWSFDALADHARGAGLTLVEHPASERDLPYQRLKTLLANGDCELPPHPTLRTDLLAVRQRASAGGVKIHLPRTADGRHADMAPSVALAAMHASGSDITDYLLMLDWAAEEMRALL